MKAFWAALGLLLGVFGFGMAAKAMPLLNEQEFTSSFVVYLKTINNNLEMEIKGLLQIKLESPDKDLGTLFLNNIYALYQQDPSRKEELFSKYASSILEHKELDSVSLDTLVAVVKDIKWAEDMDKTTMGPESKGFHILTHPLNSTLLIAFATDTPNSISYQDREKILALEKSADKIQHIAIANLRTAIGPYDFELVERDVYQAKSKTGDYDASIPLLPDAFLKLSKKTGTNNFIFAVPSRNVLLVMDAQKEKNLSYLKALTESVYKSDPYFLSPLLFTFLNGEWNIYKELE